MIIKLFQSIKNNYDALEYDCYDDQNIQFTKAFIIDCEKLATYLMNLERNKP